MRLVVPRLPRRRQDPLRADAGSRFGEADRMRRPQGGLDAVTGSGTIGR